MTWSRRRVCLGLAGAAAVAGCGPTGGPVAAGPAEIDALRQAFLALGPGVASGEAARAAEVAYSQTRALAIAYQITDPPLVHNAKVNAGIKPRGLCWHWADDLEARLSQEGFRTLALHRAIANARSRILIDHSTAILARRGDVWTAGLVLDPWRFGGRLFWAPVLEDPRYEWEAEADVFAWKLAQRR